MKRAIPVVAAVLALCARPAPAQIQFTNVASSAGVSFLNNDSQGFLMGAGVAFLDYDLDGRLDLFLVACDGLDRLERNLGGTAFQDVTASALPPGLGGLGMGIAVGDYDNDGDPDVYVTRNGPNTLLRNNGNGTFSDVTAAAGQGLADPSFSSSAVFGDFNRDGFLDLYLGNYIQILNFPYHTGYPNKLFVNNGNGTFTEVAALLGVDAGISTTLACAFTDTDGDGDQDLYVGNDFGATVVRNRLYRNDGQVPGTSLWSFTEIGQQAGMDLAIYCMGIAPGDYDNDGDLDYYMSNLGANVLMRNDGQNHFTNVTAFAGVANKFDPYAPGLFVTSWSVGFHDFDLDGWPDLYVSNGHIPSVYYLANSVNTPKALFRNNGDGTFSDVSAAAGVEDSQIGRGAAFGDFDNDGDTDILQGIVDGYAVLFRNDTPHANHYLKLKLRGTRTNRDGAGSRIRVTTGTLTQTQEVNSGYGFEAASEFARIFGLGQATRADHVDIHWLSGTEQSLHLVPADLSLELVEPTVVIDSVNVVAPLVHPGGALQATITLRNAGATAHGTALSLVAVVGNTLVPVWSASPTLAGGATVPVLVQIPIPAGLSLPPAGLPVTLLAVCTSGFLELDMRRIDVTLQ